MMITSGVAVYLFLTVFMTLICFSIARKVTKEKKLGSHLYSLTCILAGLINVVYSSSVFVTNKTLFSILSSIYFSLISIMVLSLFGFSISLNTKKYTIAINRIARISAIAVFIDVIQFIINPFTHFSIEYKKSGFSHPKYEYVSHLPYYFHLALTYILVLCAIICFIIRCKKISKLYRNPFYFAIASILLVIAINAIFLYNTNDSVLSRVDISTLTYSFSLLLIYWSIYKYSSSGMLKIFKNYVFDNIDRAILVFSNDKELIISNSIAKRFFKSESLKKGTSLREFAKINSLNIPKSLEKCFSAQYYLENDSEKIPVRCDYKPIIDESKIAGGYLFLFTDIFDETDLLTGFHNWKNFQGFISKNRSMFTENVGIAAFDINALAVINNSFGRDEGDKKIKELSDLLKNYYSENSYFVRGPEANLIAISSTMSEEQMLILARRIRNDFSGSLQYAVNIENISEIGVINAINETLNGLSVKKIQDGSSIRSEMLSTLVKALEECDKDTKMHVSRTRDIGARLGMRIGLSDSMLTNLSLLCLLHDIGKICVPLEILNKPGRLTDDEWVIMKSHTDKGYQIASSSKELCCIAEMILHHHERWDGKGYPDGLSKESIPLLSRIIAVIDAYDAMVNDRIYRPAIPKDEALRELQKCAGSQFDPHIVSELISMLNEEVDVSAELVKEIEYEDTPKIDPDFDIRVNDIKNVNVLDYSEYCIDEDNFIVDVDERFYYFTGYTKEEVLDNNMRQLDLIPESDRILYSAKVNEQLMKKPFAYIEHRLLKKNGECIQVLCMGRNKIDEATKKHQGAVITISNIMKTQAVKLMVEAEQIKAQKRLRQWESQYRTDSLTGLMNRTAFRNDVDAMLLTQNKVLLLMMDVDKFKSYNDTYGHQKGDELLILLAQSLSTILRSSDYACRMGGDEFSAALIFRNGISDEVMYTRANQLYDQLVSMMYSSLEFGGISMGAAISNESIKTFEQLYKQADRMLYNAKENGRGQIYFENN